MDFCRLCFFDTPLNVCRNLFDNQPQNEPQILDIIATLTDIRVHEDDPYPKIICYSCHEKLINFYYFRQVVLQTHIKFHYIFNDQNNNGYINYGDQDNGGQIKNEKFNNENMEIHKQIDINNEIGRFPSVFIKEETEDKKFTNEESYHVNSDSIATNENCHTSQEDKNAFTETELMICNVADEQNEIHESGEKHKLIKEEIVQVEEHFPVLNEGNHKMNGDPIIVNTSTVRRKRRNNNRKYDKKFHCSNCGNSFMSELNLKIHILQNRRKSYKCEFCCKGYNDVVIYKSHIEEQHSSNNKTYPCQLCNKEFKTIYAQQRHISLQHNTNNNNNNNIRFQCGICDRKFRYLNRLNSHLNEHNSPEPFKCDQCIEKFSSRTCLRRHLIDEHSNMDRPYKCDMCYKKFVLQGSFKNHLNSHIHHSKPYKCKYCSKRFTYENALNVHLRLHTDENLIKCKLCDRKFTHETHLNGHLPVHC